MKQQWSCLAAALSLAACQQAGPQPSIDSDTFVLSADGVAGLRGPTRFKVQDLESVFQVMM